MRWFQSILTVALCLTVVSCGLKSPPDKQSHELTIADAIQAGTAAAELDFDRGTGGIYVYRAVQQNETDEETGLPLRDGGSDAVDPMRAAWMDAYNQTMVHTANQENKH